MLLVTFYGFGLRLPLVEASNGDGDIEAVEDSLEGNALLYV